MAISLRRRTISRFSLCPTCRSSHGIPLEAHPGGSDVFFGLFRVCGSRDDDLPLLTQFAALTHDGKLIPVGILEKRHPQLVFL